MTQEELDAFINGDFDDVTKESKEASVIFHIIESVSSDFLEKEELTHFCTKAFSENVKLFTTLSQQFPHIHAFLSAKEQNEEALERLQELLDLLQESRSSLMEVMDIMQYQDIHRQKIERVIKAVHALSNYMNQLFAEKVDDVKHANSAVYNHGDNTTDDIEALLAQFDIKK